jgi:signal peptidase II
MQAARGTSVDPGDRTTAPPRRTRLRLLFVAVAATLYAVDVVTKIVAVDRLTGKPDVEVVGEVLQLHLTRNAGAAFSTGTRFTVVLACVALLAVLVVLWLSRRIGSTAWAVALGALLAGIGGNLTDRLLRDPGPFRGHVIDFLMLPNWPVFNVADMCINLGAALALVQAFRGVRIDGSRDGHEESDTLPDAEPEPAE